MRLPVLFSAIYRLLSAKRNKIANTAMTALHLNGPRSCRGRIQANLVVVPAANSKEFERFCELNKGACPLLYHSKPGDITAASLAIDSDIRYVELINTFDAARFVSNVALFQNKKKQKLVLLSVKLNPIYIYIFSKNAVIHRLLVRQTFSVFKTARLNFQAFALCDRK